jgi:hypothetical protein
MEKAPNCPFYGRHMLIWADLDQPETLAPFHLVDQHGKGKTLLRDASVHHRHHSLNVERLKMQRDFSLVLGQAA